ncbi:MAG: TIR domain-containing protein [Rhodobacteraceae bacterium]|nr:TIR domain-containing protein [Paracoccaceae bacterium]
MFDAFLSYSRTDQAAVETIAKALRSRDVTPFLDRWHLAAGQPWQEVLAARLNDCRAVLIFIGPGEMGSWQKREKERALDRQAQESGFPVVPVLLPGTEDPALDFLGLNTWIDLREELTSDDGLEALVAAINGEPPGPGDARTDPRAGICPYRGLQPFREEDAGFFFGRDAFTQTLLKKLATERFLAVVGASGSGKSSVVRAGLTPLLRAGADGQVWDILTLLPGAEPLQALVQAFDPPSPDLGRIEKIESINRGADSLRAGSVTLEQLTDSFLAEQPGTERLMLVIDQFEELYTLVADDKATDREKFLDLILAATGDDSKLSIVLTMRGDFYARALTRRDLADRLQDAVVNIGPLSATGDRMGEIEEVIRKPAEAVGLRFEDGLVERILQDVGTEPGNLPLLEFLLTELWRMRKSGVLTNDAYTDLGGVEGAIAARADATFEGLSPEQQNDARRLMLMLVRPGSGQEDTRERATIPDDPNLQALVQTFAHSDKRLLVTGEDALLGRTVEVSHEALIRNWKMLRHWIDENRDRLRARDRVRQRMLRWEGEGRPDDLLLPAGLDLEEGRTLLANAGDIPVGDIREFAEASIAADDARIAAAKAAQQAEQQREVEAQRKRRNIFAGAFVVSLVVLALAGWQWREAQRLEGIAIEQGDEAYKQALEASRQKIIAVERSEAAAKNAAGAMAALARIETDKRKGDPAKAAKLALAAWPRTQDSEIPQVEDVMVVLSDVTPKLYHQSTKAGEKVGRFSPNGAKVFAINDRSLVTLYDSESGEKITEIETYPYTESYDFSPDGKWFAASSNRDNKARIWNLESREEMEIAGGNGPLTSVSFAADSKSILLTTSEGNVVWWDLEERKTKNRWHFDLDGPLDHAAISPDLKNIAIAPRFGTVFVFDTKTKDKKSELSRFGGLLERIQYINENNLLIASRVGSKQQFSIFVAPGKLKASQTKLDLGHLSYDSETELGFSYLDRGSSDLILGLEGRIVVLNGVLKVLGGTKGHKINGSDISVKKDLLVTSGTDGNVRIWKLETGREQVRFKPDRPVGDVVFLNEDRIRIGFLDGTAKDFSISSDDLVTWRPTTAPYYWDWAISANGRFEAVRQDNIITVTDIKSGQISSKMSVGDAVSQMVLSPNGDAIAARARDGELALYRKDRASLSMSRAETEKELLTDVLLFSADGSRLLAGGGNRYAGNVIVWDTESGEPIVEKYTTGINFSGAAFLPSSRYIAVGWGFSDWQLIDLEDPTMFPGAETPNKIPGLFPEGEFLVTPDGTRIIELTPNSMVVRDATTGAAIAVVDMNELNQRLIGIEPDGNHILTFRDKTLQIGRWNLSYIPDGDVFDVVCALLPDHNLDSDDFGYPISMDFTICDAAYDPPRPEAITDQIIQVFTPQ